ncbi:MAG: fibronectin type III domain-containing protein [Elusimicrobiales bacterium]
MKKVILFFCLILNISYGFSQTKFLSDNGGKGINLSDSGGNQNLWASKAKIVRSKDWGDNFFYVIWADTGTYMGNTPLSDNNNSMESLPNANIFAIKMVKNGNSYQKDLSFGSSGLLKITDRFDQSMKEISAFPYNNGFVIAYSTSSSGNEPVGFVQYYNLSGVAQISSLGDGSGNNSLKLDSYSPGFPLTFSGNYVYYVFQDPLIKLRYCNILDQSCSSTGDLGLTTFPVDGFLVPSYDSSDPGVLLGVQADWDNNGKFNIKIKRVSPTNSWSDWVSVTNTDSVFVEYDSTESEYKGFVKAFTEEKGQTYILWLDTAPTSAYGYQNGLRVGSFYGTDPLGLSTHSGEGYHIADITISSMSVNRDNVYVYANNNRFGATYFDSTGKHLKIYDFINGIPYYQNLINLSDNDFDYRNYYFSINPSSYTVVFKRDPGGTGSTGGSLYFSAYDKDNNQLFLFTLFLSSSALENRKYSYLDVLDIGNNFAVLEHEENGSGPWSYNTYLQIVSTQLPPLENLTGLNINQDNTDPLQITLTATDNNNIINSIYVVQVSTLSDFSKIIYSTNVLNDNSSNPKTLLTLNGLTHGRTYYFRAKVVDNNRESLFVITSFVSGTEFSHESDLNIGRWSIKNIVSPLNPYQALDSYIIDARNNEVFYIWQYYDYESDSLKIKATKYDLNGNNVFEKDLVSGIKYKDGADNKFGAVSDGNGGFILVWSSSSISDTYGFISRYDSSGDRVWIRNISSHSQSIMGFDSDIKILNDKAFVFYSDSLGDVYFNSFDIQNGNQNETNFGESIASLDFVSITTTTDNGIIVFYGNSSELKAKKIDYSNSIIYVAAPYSPVDSIDTNSTQISMADNNGGAYFVYADELNASLKIFRVDSSLNQISDYPKVVSDLYDTGYGYLYNAIYTPSGPVLAALTTANDASQVIFWSNSLDNSIKEHSYNNLAFNNFSISYNSKHDIVSVGGNIQSNSKDSIYVMHYKADSGEHIATPISVAKNLYGLSVNFPQRFILQTLSDYFIVGISLPENSYIQQISTYAYLPNAPSNLSISDLQNNYLTLSWDENNSNVTQWYVRYSTKSDFDVNITTENYVNLKPYTISSLKPNTTYYFQVKSSSAIFQSSYSQTFVKSTLAEIPSDLSVQNRTHNSITLSWDSNNNGVNTLYNLVLLDGLDNEVGSSTTTSLTASFSSLSANTTYYAKVRAIGNNIGDITNYTSSVSTKTLIILSDISNITFSDVSNDSIKVSFDHPSGAKLYSIEASSVSAFDIPSVIITSMTVNKYAVFGLGGVGTLLPNTTYYFRVKAYFDDEETGYASLGNRSTDPNPPSSINTVSITSVSVNVSWSANNNPNGTRYNALVVRSSDSVQVYSSTITQTNINISGLTPNTTYFIKVKAIGNQSETGYLSSSNFKTKVALTGLSNVVFSDVLTNSFKVSWNDTVNGEFVYDVKISSCQNCTNISSTTINKYAVFGVGGAGEGNIIPNTTYYFDLRVKNSDEDASEYLHIGSTVTLANSPTGFDFVEVYSSSVSFSWNQNSNPDGTKYRIRYTSGKGNGSALFTGSNGTLTGLKGSTTYQFYLSAVNHSGVYTTELNISTVTLEAKEVVEQIGSGGGVVVFDGGSGEVKLNIPSNSFDSNITITIKLPETPPSSNKSVLGEVSATGIYVEINTGGIQPNKPVEIIMEYPSSIGFSEDTLVIARYDDAQGLWIPFKSYVDKNTRRVRAYTNHFSVFSILSLAPASTISEPKVAPNPLRPSKGLAYSNITFSNLPADADIIIYNVSGVKVRKLKTDSSGMAVWDGKNENGENVASGVYFALITKGSSNKTIKIGVQR